MTQRLTMFAETSGGMEQLQELLETADTTGGPLAKPMRQSPSLFKLAGWATIPVAALLGFAVVPSRRWAAHTVGAVVTGIAGAVGKSRIDVETQERAKPALAQVIVDHGLQENTAAAIRALQDQFGLLDEDYMAIATEVYAAYLLGMVKFNPTAKTSELKELEQLKTILQLDNIHVGEAHAMAAEEWYRTTCLFTPEEELHDPTHPDRQAMDKLLFLTERALRQGGETPEAFVFEMTRVAKAVRLDYGVALDRVAATVEPFYARALRSTRSKLTTNQVSADMLERARQSLGISEDVAFDMHIAAFNDEVRALLGLDAKSDDDDEDDDDEDDAATSATSSQKEVKFSEGAIERVRMLHSWFLTFFGSLFTQLFSRHFRTVGVAQGGVGVVGYGCTI
jgi:hypothetical protein